MAERIPGINFTGPVVPNLDSDTYPSHYAKYGKGGWREVATIADRDAISAPRREEGMAVFVTSEAKLYILNEDLETWSEFKSGSTDSIRKTDNFDTFEPLFDGEIVQYIGEDESGYESYVQGYFYKATLMEESGEDPYYVYTQIDIQPSIEVIDNVTTQSSTAALSANMGYELQEQITALSGRGRYLATWDMVTGLPTSLPTTPSPYTYHNGDYFVVARAQKAEPESFEANQTSGEPYSSIAPVMTIYKNKRFVAAGIDPVDEDDIFNYSKVISRPSEGNQGTERVAVANQGKFDTVYAQRLAYGQETYGERLISVSDDVKARWFEYGGVLYLQVMANYHYWSEGEQPQEQDSDGGYVSQNYVVSSAWTLDQKKQMVKDWFMAVAGLEITGDMYYGMAPWYEEIHLLEEDDETVDAFWTLNGEKLPAGETPQDYGIFLSGKETEYGDSIVAHYRTLKVNYKPNGSQFVYDPAPVASTTVETELVNANDTYIYDGTNWILLSNTQKEIVFGMIAGDPYDNSALADALNDKVTTTDTGNKIYGTDDQGNQTTYDKDSFGQVDDVQIHGDSKVVNKVANLLVSEQKDTMPTASADLVGRIVQYIGTTTQDYTNGYFYEAKVSGDPSSIECTATDSSTLYPYHITIDKDTFETQITTEGEYMFHYDGTNWTLDNNVISLDNYGISIQEGITYSSGDNIYIQYTESTIAYSWVAIPVQLDAVDNELSLTSENPVQNKVITEELNKKSGVIFRVFEDEEESE